MTGAYYIAEILGIPDGHFQFPAGKIDENSFSRSAESEFW